MTLLVLATWPSCEPPVAWGEPLPARTNGLGTPISPPWRGTIVRSARPASPRILHRKGWLVRIATITCGPLVLVALTGCDRSPQAITFSRGTLSTTSLAPRILVPESDDQFPNEEVDRSLPYGMTIVDKRAILRAYVHPSVPPFRFSFRGEAIQDEIGDRIEQLDGIDVYRHGATRPFQRLSTTPPDGLELEEVIHPPLELEDIDFDGFLDLGLRIDRTAYRYWRFDPKTNRFVLIPLLNGVPNPGFDPKTGVVDSYFKDGLIYWVSESFRWHGAVLKRSAKMEHDEHAETHWRWPTDGKPVVTVIPLANNRPTTELGCALWADCAAWGLCQFQGGECVPTNESCRASDRCRDDGLCIERGGECVVTEERSVGHPDELDCRSTDLCRNYGRCTLEKRTCIAAGDDCALSETCRLHGLCNAKDGWCE